jgi:pimeloyl-ACP methyl ester carboxylesterase
MNARVWDPVAAPLAARFRVLGLDARGHGDSERDPAFRYHHAAVTNDLAAVADHLGLGRFSLVGHSMGGYASIRYAARHPERVAKLVLVDAGPELPVSSRARRGADREPANPTFESEEAYVAVLARLHRRARPERLRAFAHHGLRRRADGRLEPKLDPAFLRPRSAGDPENRRAFDRARWAREEGERLWECLAEIACETLVVHGEVSPVLSASTVRRMVGSALADGRSVSIPGAGHAVMLDEPEALLAALVSFL